MRYTARVIKSFKHKGLERYFTKGSTLDIQAKHAEQRPMQLAALDTAQDIDDIDIPGYQLRPLKGSRKGIWSISVSGNWKVTFEFKDGNATIVNYEDYH